MKNKMLLLFAASSAAFALSACNSEPQKVAPVVAPVQSAPEYKSVQLGTISTSKIALHKIQDSDDIRQVVELGISLSDNGKHKEAADVFVEATKNFSSKGARLEQSLMSAAVCEYFMAGDINNVRESLKKLDSYRTSAYDKFDDNATIANIRKIVNKK